MTSLVCSTMKWNNTCMMYFLKHLSFTQIFNVLLKHKIVPRKKWPVNPLVLLCLISYQMNYYNIHACDLINPQIPKLTTLREISLLVIKETSGRARNNIQVLNLLDHIFCLVNYTLTSCSNWVCFTPDGSQNSERNNWNKSQRLCSEMDEHAVSLLTYWLPRADFNSTSSPWALCPWVALTGDSCTCPEGS